MFQCALGRLHSPILLPRESLPLYVYVDAGGRAGSKRVWGGLAVLGDTERRWVHALIQQLARQNAAVAEPTGEVKGRNLTLESVIGIGRQILGASRRILFWANWYPPPDEATTDDMVQRFAAIRANRWRLDAANVQAKNDSWATYLQDLVPVNRWKVLSLLAHLQWLTTAISNARIGPQIGRAVLYGDREDLPNSGRAAELVKAMFASSLQRAGMSLRTTGRAYEESSDEGGVAVHIGADSAKDSGLQLVDILLQAVQRQLPGARRPPFDTAPRP